MQTVCIPISLGNLGWRKVMGVDCGVICLMLIAVYVALKLQVLLIGDIFLSTSLIICCSIFTFEAEKTNSGYFFSLEKLSSDWSVNVKYAVDLWCTFLKWKISWKVFCHIFVVFPFYDKANSMIYRPHGFSNMMSH